MRNLRSLRRTCPRRRLPPEQAVHIDFSDIHSVKEDDRQCSDNMRNAKSEESTTENLKGEAGIDSRTQRPAHSGFAVSIVKTIKKRFRHIKYSKTNLYNDPSGAAMSADTHLDDINRVALKLYNYDFVKECVGKSTFSIQTPQGEFTWKNTNKFLDKKSPYYNENVKGIKTGTMASSYNIVVLYKKDGKEYLITCLASLSDEGRYKAVQSAINTIIK